MKIEHKTSHQERRQKEYPAVTDQIDAIYKGFAALSSGQPLPQATLDWVAQIEAIKNKYPKVT